MPELPEVQTVVNDLQILVGDTIMDFSSRWPKALKDETGKTISEKILREKLLGKKILSIQRLGKNIVINLSEKFSLVAHLRMTGQLILGKEAAPTKNPKHSHHNFTLKQNRRLDFVDIRKFGTLQLLPTDKLGEKFSKLGIDPFAKNFSLETFTKLFEKKYQKSLKEFLMDQAVILGIGNIYACEILFASKISPQRKLFSLSKTEIQTLYKNILKILTLAIKLRGTSVSDYRDASGKKGSFQNELKVYKKLDQPCQKCATMIKRIVLGQRSTFYCPKCQK